MNHNLIFDIDSVQNLNLMFRIGVNFNRLNKIDCIRNLTKMQIFESSNNQIESIEDNLFDGLDLLKRLDLSSNRIKQIKSSSNSISNLNFINISFNQFENIDFIKTYSKLKHLLINNNNKISILKSMTYFLNNKKDLFRLDLSFNKIDSFDYSGKIDLSKCELLKYVNLDVQLIGYLEEFTNVIIAKRNEAFTFIKSLFILTKNDLNFIDCKLIFNYLKRNIHLNLFFNDQIDRFLLTCNLDDFQ
jgi:Leucine-rich repeat (LRR) protein